MKRLRHSLTGSSTNLQQLVCEMWQAGHPSCAAVASSGAMLQRQSSADQRTDIRQLLTCAGFVQEGMVYRSVLAIFTFYIHFAVGRACKYMLLQRWILVLSCWSLPSLLQACQASPSGLIQDEQPRKCYPATVTSCDVAVSTYIHYLPATPAGFEPVDDAGLRVCQSAGLCVCP